MPECVDFRRTNNDGLDIYRTNQATIEDCLAIGDSIVLTSAEFNQLTETPQPIPIETELEAEQLDLILYCMIFCAMCICGCIGATAHEGAAR
jgi:hypothetical protein